MTIGKSDKTNTGTSYPGQHGVPSNMESLSVPNPGRKKAGTLQQTGATKVSTSQGKQIKQDNQDIVYPSSHPVIKNLFKVASFLTGVDPPRQTEAITKAAEKPQWVQEKEAAVQENLFRATRSQCKKDFPAALMLLQDAIETSKNHKIDLVQIIQRSTPTIVDTSIMCKDHNSYELLVEHNLIRFFPDRPSLLVAYIGVKDVKSVSCFLRAHFNGVSSWLDRATSPEAREGAYHLTGPDLAIAQALVETDDATFISEVVGSVLDAADIAMGAGKVILATKILGTVNSVDHNSQTPQPELNQSPPPYVLK